jgi:urease accessory protein
MEICMSNAHRFVCSLLLLLPTAALAHPGHELTLSFAEGLWHPLTGADHVLAMIATGMWATQLSRRAALLLPMVFATAMLMGGALFSFGLRLPAIEPMIALSVVMLGVLIAAQVRVNAVLGASLIATFAIFHGYAHASEAMALQIPFAVGFVIATACLNFVGVWFGARLLARNSKAIRMAGALIGASGAMLLLGA